MTNCTLLTTCIFFNDKMAHMPVTADVLKNKYCRAKYAECARYMVMEAMGRQNVPPNLIPGQTDLARQIIDEAKRTKA